MNKTKILIRNRDTSGDASGSTGVITFTDNWVAQSYQYTFTGTTMTHQDMFTTFPHYYSGKAVIFNADTVSNQSWWQNIADDFGSVYALDDYPMSGFSDCIGFNNNNDIGGRVLSATSFFGDAYQTTGNVHYDPNVKEILTDNPDADYISNAGGYCHIPLKSYGIIVSVVTSDAVVHAANIEMDLGDAAVKTALDALSIGTWTVTSNATHMVLVSNLFVGCDSVNVVAYDGVSSPQELLYSDRIYFWPYAAPSTLSLDGTPESNYMVNVGTGGNAYSNNLIVRGSGKIVVGGNFTDWDGTTVGRLVQLNADASLDATWTTNTGTGANSPALNIAEQTADGKVLVAGVFTTWNSNSRTALVRLNADGTEDSAFYTNLGTSFNFSPYSVAVQSDGKILCGGPFISLNGNSRLRMVRLNSDGTEDTAFYTNMGTAFNDVVNFVKELQGGKILVVGRFTTFNGNTRNRVVLLNPNGTEDTTFYANCGTGFNAPVRGVYELSTGRLVFYGEFTSFNGASKGYIVELEQDGSLYTNFDTGTGFNTPIYNVSEQPDGNIVVGGPFASFDGTAAHTVVRLYPDGSLDTSFTANITGSEIAVAVDATLPDIIILAEIGGTNFRIIHQYKPNRNKYYFYEDGYDYAYQAGVLTPGQSYSIDMDLTSITGAGDIVVYFGTTAVGSYSFVGGEPDGVRTFSGTANGTDLKIGISYNLNLTVGATASSTTGGLTTTFTGGTYWLDTYGTTAFPITYQITDVFDIGSTNSSYSKTVTLPGSKNNNKVLKHVSHPGGANSWDIDARIETQVLSDGVPVLEGTMTLERTITTKMGVDYEVTFNSTTTDLFTKIRDLKFKDLDWSSINHTLEPATMAASWPEDHTWGYKYPLIDRGHGYTFTKLVTTDLGVDYKELPLAPHCHKIIELIGAEVGLEIVSDFFETPMFKQLIRPIYGKLTRNITATVHGDYNRPTSPIAVQDDDYMVTSDTTFVMQFMNFVAAGFTAGVPVTISGTRWSDGTYTPVTVNTSSLVFPPGTFVTDSNGNYDQWTQGLANVASSGTSLAELTVRLLYYSNDGTTLTELARYTGGSLTSDTNFALTYTGDVPADAFMVVGASSEGGDIELLQNTYFRVLYNDITAFAPSGDFRAALSADHTVTATEFHVPFDNDSSWPGAYDTNNSYNTTDHEHLTPYTDAVSYLSTCEDSVEDFLISLVKMFNLVVASDPTGTSVTIETSDDYYDNSTVVRDWTHRLDRTKDFTSEILTSLQYRNFKWSYDNADDYYNTAYTDETTKVFGEYSVGTATTQITDVYEVTAPAYPTPSVSMTEPLDTFLTIPVIATDAPASLGAPATGIVDEIGNRILFFKYAPMGGTLRFFFGWHYGVYGNVTIGDSEYYQYTTSAYRFYPYCGMFSDPYYGQGLADYNLEFGISDRYYAGPGPISSLQNTLYDLYWKRTAETVSDPDSRFVTCYVDLSPADIGTLKFSDRILIDGVYYRLNKIVDWDCASDATTKVELYKVLDQRLPAGMGWTDLTVIK